MYDNDEEKEEIKISLWKCFEDQFFIYKNLKRTFTVETTASTKKIIWVDNLGIKRSTLFSEFNNHNLELYKLISKVKKDARIYDEFNENKFYNNSGYVNFDTRKLFKKGICFKCDVKAAYWNTAKFFLSNETYDLGIKNKPERLKSLGVLAKKTTTTQFINGELVLQEIKRGPYSYLFFQIAEIIDNLFKFAFDNGVFGYYVDCFFCDDLELTKDLINYFNTLDYELTFEQCEYRLFNNQIVIDNKAYYIKT